MGIIKPTPEQYETSFRKLFPQGDYWDRQFSNPQSDVSLFCQAKLPEFISFRGKMDSLRDESKPQSAVELLDDWERVLNGSVLRGLNIQQRRMMLLQKNKEKITRGDLQKIADIFGFVITDVRLPYRPAFFGFNYFGIDNIASPAAWQVIHIYVLTKDNGEQSGQFENAIRISLLANHITYFFYDGGKS
jgi:uncharacterized protein YmfQ (DUF2313 family)